LDAALIFPAVLIFWGARKRIAAQKNVAVQEQKTDEMTQREAERSSSLPLSLANTSSIWILLLSIAMMLSAIGDTGFAFSTAYGPDSVQEMYGYGSILRNY
jgi:hypothetical protein